MQIIYPSAKKSNGLAISQQQKEEVVFNHFVNLLGQTQVRTASLNWNNPGYVREDLSELEDPFEPEEIKQTIMSLPSEKASGPDVFIGLSIKLI
jgi:hypothetical protein